MDAVYPANLAVQEDFLEPLEYEPEIILPDERQFTPDTTAVPFRWICRLSVNYGGRDVQVSTGTLISPRHVLTAAHVLTRFDRTKRRIQTAQSIRVTPGYNCAATVPAPFGSTTSAAWHVPAIWRAGVAKAGGPTRADRQFDYGLITLREPIGDRRAMLLGNLPLGYWGSRTRGFGTRINPKTPASIRGLQVNLSGYPFDKCCKNPRVRSVRCPAHLGSGAQFRSFARITDPAPAAFPRLIFYNLDTFGGHSGAPVWLRWEKFRNLIAVHNGPSSAVVPGQRGISNRGVRITQDVMNNVRAWMRL